MRKLLIPLLLIIATVLSISLIGKASAKKDDVVSSGIFATQTPWLVNTAVPTQQVIPTRFVIRLDTSIDPTLVGSIDFVTLEEKSVIYTEEPTSPDTYSVSAPLKPSGPTDVQITYKTYHGKQYEVYWVDNSYCQNVTQGYMIKLFVKKFMEKGVPVKYGMPLVQSESNFEEYVVEQGQCRLKQNNNGAPAYCAGQIYSPAHTKVDYRRLAVDPQYCVDLSVAVYVGAMSGADDWITAAAWYKGFGEDKGGKNNTTFADNYMPPYNKGYYSYAGFTIPFSDEIYGILDQLP